MRDGNQIVIDAAPDATDRNVRLFLLGSALGALLHQRGLLPLHANAIDLGGGAVAFSGHSGAGKSTIAAWFHDRGHRILADDVCVVGFDQSGRALVHAVPRPLVPALFRAAYGSGAGTDRRISHGIQRNKIRAVFHGRVREYVHRLGCTMCDKATLDDDEDLSVATGRARFSALLRADAREPQRGRR